MNGQAVVTVSAAVVALVQLCKWGGIPDKFGPLAVLVLAALGVGVWGYSQAEAGFARQETFSYFAGWIAVATSAAGIFGFTRAAGSAVIAAKAPPGGGAGSDRTMNAPDLTTRKLDALAASAGAHQDEIERLEQAIRDLRADIGATPHDPAPPTSPGAAYLAEQSFRG